MWNEMTRFARDETGATMIEYGLVIAIVALSVVTVLSFFGSSVKSTFTTVDTTMQNARPE